ncbi:hypothetical protein JMJ56_03790 [Belnapia sp. T18]|uniref:Uncharacterized protein n=1 Tax=Belnapia arida TaxID=2804533 RepID=A0ABS1TY00_9PROT|nr:hypothetical protein [Belnapia arida]MBL6077115.1 hypothetical protein [Belnapia arida]
MPIRAQRSAAIFASPASLAEEAPWRSAWIHPPELWQLVPKARSMPADQPTNLAIAPMPRSADIVAHGLGAAADAGHSAFLDADFDGEAGHVLSCGTSDGGQHREDWRP